ncbi:MAG: EamA family transporter, partial [Pseudomonadota bacterium]|nr:EamA family transporter [Pseudomonadota bacterium]
MKQTHNPLAMSPTLWGMLILLSFVWGGTFFFQEIAVRELPVFTIVAVRVVVAAAFLSVLLIL